MRVTYKEYSYVEGNNKRQSSDTINLEDKYKWNSLLEDKDNECSRKSTTQQDKDKNIASVKKRVQKSLK